MLVFKKISSFFSVNLQRMYSTKQETQTHFFEKVQGFVRSLKSKRNYIDYDENNNQFYSVPNARPNNQGKKTVLQKIKKRIQALNNENVELTELQKKFLSQLETNSFFLKKSGIDIVHNISFKRIKQQLVHDLNNPQHDHHVHAFNFADEIFSSDDEESRESFKTLYTLSKKRKKSFEKDKKIELTNTLLDKLNSASRNLMPGYSSTNRSIGAHRDPHLAIKAGSWFETKRSKKLSLSADAYFGEPYLPKKGSDPHTYQSSSISPDIKKATYSHFLEGEESDIEADEQKNAHPKRATVNRQTMR